jgi:Flp pilus assembly pilin Flp
MITWTPKASLPTVNGHIWRNQRGVAAVEFGLVATVLAVLLPAATDLALAIWANQQVGNAARAGSEYAAEHCWNGSTSAVDTAPPTSPPPRHPPRRGASPRRLRSFAATTARAE